MTDELKACGRFGHHPDPAIDFCVEVEEIQSIALDRGIGFPNPDNNQLEDRIFRAMQFNVGGDGNAVRAKALLRQIETQVHSSRPNPEGQVTEAVVDPMICGDCGWRGSTVTWLDRCRGFPCQLKAAFTNTVAPETTPIEGISEEDDNCG